MVGSGPAKQEVPSPTILKGSSGPREGGTDGDGAVGGKLD